MSRAGLFASLCVLPSCFTWSTWDPPRSREIVRELDATTTAAGIATERGDGFVLALAPEVASSFVGCWPDFAGPLRGLRCEPLSGPMPEGGASATSATQPTLWMHAATPQLGWLEAANGMRPCTVTPLRELPAGASLDRSVQVVLWRERALQRSTFVCVLATPCTLLLDVITSPAQLLVGIYLLAEG